MTKAFIRKSSGRTAGYGGWDYSVRSYTELEREAILRQRRLDSLPDFEAAMMDMAVAYRLGSPESRAIVTAMDHARAITAQGIEARQGGDGTAPREARKPDPKGCAHD